MHLADLFWLKLRSFSENWHFCTSLTHKGLRVPIRGGRVPILSGHPVCLPCMWGAGVTSVLSLSVRQVLIFQSNGSPGTAAESGR